MTPLRTRWCPSCVIFLHLEGHATDAERSLRTFQMINVQEISAPPGHHALTMVAVSMTIHVFRQTYNDDTSMTVSAAHVQARRKSLAKCGCPGVAAKQTRATRAFSQLCAAFKNTQSKATKR